MEIKIKVCGMKNPDNIREIAALNPDFMGFIFIDSSPRFVGKDFVLPELAVGIKRAGVFANQNLEYISNIVETHKLDVIQLHGNETPKFCLQIKQNFPNLTIWKAFQIDDSFDNKTLTSYQETSDAFLLDTKDEKSGGSGRSFNWSLLKKYDIQKSLVLAGGLGPDNINQAAEFLAELSGISDKSVVLDINSKAETSPGLKSVDIVRKIIQTIRMQAS